MKHSFLTVMFLFLFTGLIAQNPWVNLYSGSTYDLDGTGARDTLYIPLKLDSSVSFSKVEVKKPIYARLNNKFRQSYIQAFTITKGDTTAPSIRLIADLSRIKTGGTYELMLAFTAPKHQQQTLALSLVRPSAKLDTLTIRIHVEGDEIISDPLVMREVSNASNISDMKLTSPQFTGSGREDLIAVAPGPYQVKAGSALAIKYEVRSKALSGLPLGKTKGRLEINAPELSAPLIIPFEITIKKSKTWILVFMFLGLLTGAFVRNFIKNKKAWEETRLKGFDLIEKIRRETKDIEDEDFRAEIRALIKELADALESKSSILQFTTGAENPLTKKIEETTTAYNEKKKAFEETLKKVRESLTEVSYCFEDSSLSVPVSVQLTGATKFYRQAKENLIRRNVRQAQINIHSAIKEANEFISAYDSAVSELLKALQGDSFYPALVPDDAKTKAKAEAVKIQTSLSELKKNSDDAKEVTASVNKTDSIHHQLSMTLTWLEEQAGNVAREYTFKLTREQDLQEKFHQCFNDWKAMVEALKADPLKTLDETPVRKLNEVWTEVQKATTAQERTYGNTVSKVSYVSEPGIQWKSAIARGAYFIESGSSMQTIEVTARESKRNWWLYAIVQTFILSLLLGLGAYKFYGPSFIGTTDELITIFLFAFGLDITADNVLQLRDKK